MSRVYQSLTNFVKMRLPCLGRQALYLLCGQVLVISFKHVKTLLVHVGNVLESFWVVVMFSNLSSLSLSLPPSCKISFVASCLYIVIVGCSGWLVRVYYTILDLPIPVCSFKSFQYTLSPSLSPNLFLSFKISFMPRFT